MIVEVDLHLMRAHGLNLEDYIVLQLLSKKEFDEVDSCFPDESYLQNILDKLVKKKFIILKEYGFKDCLGDYKILSLPKVLSADFDKWFDELTKLYPKFVRRPDGLEDNLFTNLPKCKDLYKKAIKGNKHNHDHIIECLKFQLLQVSRKPNGLSYMKKLSKWIDEEVWKDYEDMLNKHGAVNGNNINDTQIYGGRII